MMLSDNTARLRIMAGARELAHALMNAHEALSFDHMTNIEASRALIRAVSCAEAGLAVLQGAAKDIRDQRSNNDVRE